VDVAQCTSDRTGYADLAGPRAGALWADLRGYRIETVEFLAISSWRREWWPAMDDPCC